MLKIFNVFFPYSDFLYILQQEEYSSVRFIYWLPRFFFKRNIQVRDTLKYTKRVKGTLGLAVLLHVLKVLVLLSLGLTIFIPFTLLFVPIYVLVSNYALTSYYNSIKSNIRSSAEEKLKKQPNIKVITVAGSYGKTTVKNFLQQIIKYSYKTQMIPGNINTPAGIANWINKELSPDTEVLISEVDSFEIGEIAKSTKILRPDIAIITNIGDQHLVRFGNRENLACALSETFVYSKEKAKLISTKEVFEMIERSSENDSREEIAIDDYDIDHLDVVANLSASIKTNLMFALQVARVLNIPERFIDDALTRLTLPDRRQKLTDNILGFQGIDDSYNISFSTALAGIQEARKQADKNKRKLLVITAGIPELSDENIDKNIELGKVLSKNADHVIVLKSILHEDVVCGLKESSFEIIDSFKKLVDTELSKFNKDDWFLLLQPELNDLYY